LPILLLQAYEDDGRIARRCCAATGSRRQSLEALAIEDCRSGALTHYEASRLLQLSRFEFDALLKRGNVDDHACDVEDLEQDLETLERLEASGLMRRL
jgi:predicted HTH domain antitoxin